MWLRTVVYGLYDGLLGGDLMDLLGGHLFIGCEWAWRLFLCLVRAVLSVAPRWTYTRAASIVAPRTIRCKGRVSPAFRSGHS